MNLSHFRGQIRHCASYLLLYNSISRLGGLKQTLSIYFYYSQFRGLTEINEAVLLRVSWACHQIVAGALIISKVFSHIWCLMPTISWDVSRGCRPEQQHLSSLYVLPQNTVELNEWASQDSKVQMYRISMTELLESYVTCADIDWGSHRGSSMFKGRGNNLYHYEWSVTVTLLEE